MKSGKRASLVVVYLLGMVAVHAMVLWRARTHISDGYGDFAAFYTAGKIVQQGRADKLYDPDSQWKVQQEFASAVKIRLGPLPYIRPPFEALLFFPLAYLSYPVASVVWIVLKVLVLLAIPFLLVSFQDAARPPPLVQGIFCMGFAPVAFDLLLGQDSILLLLVFVLAFRAMQTGKEMQSGALLALGLFKFHLVFPIFMVFLLRRKIRTVSGFLCASGGLFLISLFMVGWKGVLFYPKYLWRLNQVSGVGLLPPALMPNFHGLFSPFVGQFHPLIFTELIFGAIAAAGVLFTTVVWKIKSRDYSSTGAGLSLAIVVTLLTGVYAANYDMTLLLLPALLLGRKFLLADGIHGWPRTLFIACFAVLWFSPLYWELILHLHEFYWMALVLILLAASLARTIYLWQSKLTENELPGTSKDGLAKC